MKKLTGQLILVFGVTVIALVATLYFTFRWVDNQKIPVTSDARNTLRFIAFVYPLLPGRCDEMCVVRVIKIANLVALSQYGKKSPLDFSKDIGIGFSLLDAALIKGDLPDRTAEYEVSLERLMFFNRMNAFAINFGRRLEGNDFLDKTLSLQGYAYDEETKAALRREEFIYGTLHNSQRTDLNIYFSEITSELAFPDVYQLMASGWALCAVRNDKGADYLNRALPFIKGIRMNIIHAISRNLDAPLIAAAEKHAACQNGIFELKKLLSGD